MSDLFHHVLGGISGGRVLDVATAEGGFIGILVDHLRDYTEIVGIDVNEGALRTAQSTCRQGSVHFAQMDAEQLGCPGESFDTVNISASLHHLADPPRVLAEMARVLRPGGHLIVTEMHCDGDTEAQLTTVCLHQWVAAVDAALGVSHYSTLARQQILGLVGELGLCHVVRYDFSDTGSDPMDEVLIRRLEELVDESIERAGDAPNAKVLQHRGEALRRRLHQFGAQREPVLVVVGVKYGKVHFARAVGHRFWPAAVLVGSEKAAQVARRRQTAGRHALGPFVPGLRLEDGEQMGS